MKKNFSILAAVQLLVAVSAWAEHSLELEINHPSGIYAVGERATVKVALLNDGKLANDKVVRWQAHPGAPGWKDLDFSKPEVGVDCTKPCRVRFEFRVYEANGKTPVRDANGQGIIVGIGALVSPEKLVPNREEPADFDAYWQGEIARDRAACPLDPAKVTMRTMSEDREYIGREVIVPTGRSQPACCCVTLPKGAKPKSLPLFVRVCGAGTVCANTSNRKGMIDFCISPHGCPFGNELTKFFKEGNPGYRYQYQHWDDREKCYFHDQIIRDIRALEWAKTIPEWNGRDIIVFGFSMGGSQAVQVSALDKDITLAAIGDPALCDLAGGALGTRRQPGWPMIAQTNAAEIAASAYFDNIFFARRIKCPVMFFTGLVDPVCEPMGQMLCYNAIKTEKTLTTDPLAWHCAVGAMPLWRRLAPLQGVPKPAMTVWVYAGDSNAWNRALYKLRRAKASGRLLDGQIKINVGQAQNRNDLPWVFPADLDGTERNPVVVKAQSSYPFLPAGEKRPRRLFRLEKGVKNVTFEGFNFNAYGPEAVTRE